MSDNVIVKEKSKLMKRVGDAAVGLRGVVGGMLFRSPNKVAIQTALFQARRDDVNTLARQAEEKARYEAYQAAYYASQEQKRLDDIVRNDAARDKRKAELKRQLEEPDADIGTINRYSPTDIFMTSLKHRYAENEKIRNYLQDRTPESYPVSYQGNSEGIPRGFR